MRYRKICVNLWFVISGILICVICGSCVITKVHTMPVEKFSGSYDLVWDSVITYLDKEKEPITVSDKEKGIISTDWVIMQKVFGAKRYRYDIQMTKLAENEVQVGIASPQEAYSMGDWEEILPSERRAHRIFRFVRVQIRKVVGIGKVSERPFSKRQYGLSR